MEAENDSVPAAELSAAAEVPEEPGVAAEASGIAEATEAPASTANGDGEAAAAPEGVSAEDVALTPAAEAPVEAVERQQTPTLDVTEAARTERTANAAGEPPADTEALACEKVKEKKKKKVNIDKARVRAPTIKPEDDETLEIAKKIQWVLQNGAQANVVIDSEGWVMVQDLITCEVLSSTPEARLLRAIDEAISQGMSYEVKASEGGQRMIRVASSAASRKTSREVDSKPDCKPDRKLIKKNGKRKTKAQDGGTYAIGTCSALDLVPDDKEGDGAGELEGGLAQGGPDPDQPALNERESPNGGQEQRVGFWGRVTGVLGEARASTSGQQPHTTTASTPVRISKSHLDDENFLEKQEGEEAVPAGNASGLEKNISFGDGIGQTHSLSCDHSRSTETAKARTSRSRAQSRSTVVRQRPRSILDRIARRSHESNGEHGSGGGHGARGPSIVTAGISAGINFLLMFGLCCAYGMIMFEDEWNARHRGLAVKMNLATAMIAGLLLACFSGVPVAIGGPDLNPVVFLGMFVTTIAGEIANQLGMELPESSHRRLGSSSSEGANFCTGSGSSSESSSSSISLNDCEAYHDQLRATTIFAVTLSSAILGVLYFCLGRFNLTRFLAYIPTNIIEAFLSCIGYKVFKYALKFCKYNPRQFIPAACIGVPLYFVKAMHLGNPAIVIPIMLIFPLALFYGGVYATGGTVDSVRDTGWMFDVIDNSPFYTVWTDGLVGNISKINFSAWSATLTDLPIMIAICLMDCLLKLSSTDSKLPVKPEKDYEVQLYGATNALTTVCGSSVGYMQLKFNVINYGVMGNVTDRRGGAMYAILCGVCFFWSTDMFNYLPRFFLSTLLFFAGTGFVAENLWGSRLYLSLYEWLQILVILAVFIAFGSLLYAVVVGGLLTGATFVLRYAKVPCLAAPPATGGGLRSCERRSELVSYGIRHISDSWLMVVRLKGYIFFASAQKVIDWVSEYIDEKADNVPEYRRLKYIIFDCSQLDGMDPSASKAVSKLVQHARELEVRVLWSEASEEFIQRQKVVGTISCDSDVLTDLGQGVHKAEESILDFMAAQQQLWVGLHPCLLAYREWHRLRAACDPFAQILATDMARFSCPWKYCTVMSIKGLTTTLWNHGDHCKDLFLVHSGSVGLYTSMPVAEEDFLDPALVYGHGFFLNPESLLNADSKYFAMALEDGELLRWDEASWERMVCEKPRMASALMTEMLRQQRAENQTDPMLGAATTAAAPRSTRRSSVKSHHSKPQLKACASRTRLSILGEVESISSKHRHAGYDELPNALQKQLQGLVVAQQLEDMGFFNMPEPGEEVALPKLPDCLVQDLLVAYNTILQDPTTVAPTAVDGTNGQNENADEWDRQASEAPSFSGGLLVREALAHAGLHGVLLEEDSPQWLGWDDFLELGRQATFMQFSETQSDKARELFQNWKKRQPDLIDRPELIAFVRHQFCSDLCPAEIDDIADLWCRKSLDLDEDTFVAFISRFVRKHEHLWWLLQGLRALVRKERLDKGARITPADILTAEFESFQAFQAFQAGDDGDSEAPSRHPITQQQAHAMLWGADSDASTHGDTADCRLATGILFQHFALYCKLPRAPVMSAANTMVASLEKFKFVRAKRQMKSQVQAEPEETQSQCVGSRNMLALMRATESGGITQQQRLLVDSRSLTGTEASRFAGLLSAVTLPKPVGRDSFLGVGMSEALVAPLYSQHSEKRIVPQTARGVLQNFLEDPSSGPWANRFSLFMGMMILAAVLTLFLEPLVCSEEPSESEENTWFAFEAFFSIGFTIELLLRFVVADALGTSSQVQFLKTPMNIIDFVAVVPFYVDLAFRGNSQEFRLMRVIRLARLARVMRLARLMKRSATFAPIAVVLVVIWGVYMKNGITG